MMLHEPSSIWQVSGASVRGAAHVRQSLPNQDAIAWRSAADADGPIVIALADGHGSPRCLRSHRGAKFAVRLALDLLEQFAAQHADESNLSAVKSAAEDRLLRGIVRSWQDLVQDDLASKPFGRRDWDLLTKHSGTADQEQVLARPLAAYGTTLLATLITPRYFLFLQLGDGDIVIVDAKGCVDRPPFPHDPRLIANQTTSLSGPTAWTDVRLHFQPFAGRSPDLIMLSTDGYANSFADDAGFCQAGADLLMAVRQFGIRRISYRLRKWLRSTSELGSGDDITVGLVYRSPPPS